MDRPILGITMGDPAGVGAEVIVKALADPAVYARSRPLVVGDLFALRDALRITGLPLSLAPVGRPEEGGFVLGRVDVLDLANVDRASFRYGRVSAMCGRAALEYLDRTIDLAVAGSIAALGTGPIHKESIHLAGCPHAGHTEILAAKTETRDYAMMLVSDGLRVAHVSAHVSLREAIERVRRPRVLTVIRLAHRAALALGVARPRIAVAGLNPHAGEHGLFGTEEIAEIAPAIEEARAEGLEVEGPVAPDTVFARARGGLSDVVVCMYHDQGHAPLKTLGFTFDGTAGTWTSVSGVNVTLGLPIVRTSVDHGTAFDQAGKGTASDQSLRDAIHVAVTLVNGRRAGVTA